MARTFGLITLFVLFVSSAFSQTSEFPWAIRAGGGMMQYYAHPGTNALTSAAFHPSIELGASRYLAGGFDFRTQLTIAPKVVFPLSGETSVSSPLVDMNYLMAFKFNNGVFFRESAFLGPYILFGVGGSYVQNQPDAYIPLGGGLQMRINPKMSVRVESVRKLSVNKKPQTLAHALAFVYNLGSPTDIPPGTFPKEIEEELATSILMSRDSDLDGIVDQEDDCPNHPGYIQYLGCPTADKVANEAFASTSTDETDYIEEEELRLADIAPEGAGSADDLMSFDALDEYMQEESEIPSGAMVEEAPESLEEIVISSTESASLQEPQPPTVSDAPIQEEEIETAPLQEAAIVVEEVIEAPVSNEVAIVEEVIESPETDEIAEGSSFSPCTNHSLPNSEDMPIFFAYGSHELKNEAKDQLKELADVTQVL